MAHITITNMRSFLRVARQVRRAGLYPRLREQLHLLQSFGTGDRHYKGCEVRLAPDGQTWSFDFRFFAPDGHQLVAGGLIFHPGPGGHEEAVVLEAPAAACWRLHS